MLSATKVAENSRNNPTTSASSSPLNELPAGHQSPFEFLEDIVPDRVAIVHAVILSGLTPTVKNEICMKVAINSEFFNRYTDWRKRMARTPPPNCLGSLPLKVQQSIKEQLDCLHYEKVREVCKQYSQETAELTSWMNIICDKKNAGKYLDLVFERAKITLEEFLKNGTVPEEANKASTSAQNKIKKPPVKMQRTAEERKTRGLVEKLAPTLADVIATLEHKKKTLEEGKVDKSTKKQEKNTAIEAEKAFVLNACVQLSVFLNDHSTDEDPFVKAMIAQAEKEQKTIEEQQKNKKSRDPPPSHNFGTICSEHMDNVKRAMEKSQAPLTVPEVRKLIINLTNLKTSGQLITSAMRL